MKTELLVQMDGLARSDDLVFLLAASNLPWQVYCTAITGFISLPSCEGLDSTLTPSCEGLDSTLTPSCEGLDSTLVTLRVEPRNFLFSSLAPLPQLGPQQRKIFNSCPSPVFLVHKLWCDKCIDITYRYKVLELSIAFFDQDI